MFLSDVNFWLALSFDRHLHHQAAKQWFRSSTDPHFFCRPTQQGFLRLATNQNIFADDTKSLFEAWVMWDEILSDYRVNFISEPANLEQIWRSYTQQNSFAHNLWTDAFLAAYAKASDLKLITFDKGFAQFPDLNYQLITTV